MDNSEQSPSDDLTHIASQQAEDIDQASKIEDVLQVVEHLWSLFFRKRDQELFTSWIAKTR